MNKNLTQINTEVYERCALKISDFQLETERKEYDACRFELNGQKIISRSAKITPKKAGQFVTFWKRNGSGPIEPLEENDQIDFYTVNLRTKNNFGQFVFPKSILIKKGIIKNPNGIEEIKWILTNKAIELITLPHINVMIEKIMTSSNGIWGGALLQFKENDDWKAKILEEFYTL